MKTEIFVQCHSSLSTYFRMVINLVFLYTQKKKIKQKLGV